MVSAAPAPAPALSGGTEIPDGIRVKKEADWTGQFMASGGVATAIILGIGYSLSMKMSLAVGLTLGFGLGPVFYLGSLAVSSLFKKIFEVACPGKYQKWESYLQEVRALKQVKVGQSNYEETQERIKILQSENRDVAWIQSTFYFVALISVAVSLFFFINGVIGSLGILPFIGAIAIMCVLLNFIPKPSEMVAYVRAVFSPTGEQRDKSVWERILGLCPRAPEPAPPIADFDRDPGPQ